MSTLAAGCGGGGDNPDAAGQPDAGTPADAADLGCQPVDDSNDCTQDLCDGDDPVYIDVAAGTACATGVCDGAGACVECLTNDDCGTDACDQATNACFTPQVGLVANAGDDSVTFFRPDTMEVGTTVALSGTFPWEITLSTDGTLAYVINRDSADISIVSLDTETEVGTIALTGTGPSKAVIASDGFLYVTYTGSAFLSKVDLTADPPAEVDTVDLLTDTASNAIAMTPDGDFLYVGNSVSNILTKIEVATGMETDAFTTGTPPEINDIVIDAAGLAYLASSTNGELVTWDTGTDTATDARPLATTPENLVDLVLYQGTLFGATIRDNESAGALTVVDPAATVTDFEYAQDDDGSYTVDLPFTFSFDGTDYTSVYNQSNGWVDVAQGNADGYDFDIGDEIGFGAFNQDLDSGTQYFGYSSRTFADHAVFQWSTATNNDVTNPRAVSVFEIVLFDDGTARFDYLSSGPLGIDEDDGYEYGVGDGSGTALVNLRAVYGSPWSLQRRTFLWDPATPGAVIEMPFTWEGTGAVQLPIVGQPGGVAVTGNLVFLPLEVHYSTDTDGFEVLVYDRATMLPIGMMTVGARPSAIVIR